ncbi:MAG TPA: hypothetical protein PJ982_13260 [Lacipirellulaceae bacterium]|nr:hypothetical protein [Lacipirellulaceae bacterium]
METDFHHGGNGVGLIISSRPACSAAGRPVDWLDRIAPRSIPDGLSHTLLAGERHVAQEQIGLPPYDGPMFDGSHLPSIAALAGPGFPISPGPTHRADTPYTFGSWHPQHCHMALADGSVHAVANDIDPLLLARLANRQDER